MIAVITTFFLSFFGVNHSFFVFFKKEFPENYKKRNQLQAIPFSASKNTKIIINVFHVHDILWDSFRKLF